MLPLISTGSKNIIDITDYIFLFKLRWKILYFLTEMIFKKLKYLSKVA